MASLINIMHRNLLLIAIVLLFTSPTVLAEDNEPALVAKAFVTSVVQADLPLLLSLFADDATFFTPLPDYPVRLHGKQEIAALFEPFFTHLHESQEGPIYLDFVPIDVKSQIYGDTAVVTFHLGGVGVSADGRKKFSRRTAVLRRIGNDWRIVHFHASNMLLPAGNTRN